ncbi:hypothetical protein FGADI_11387 [Fusarium gaditjirri]|uniref:Uncharacterized protein n=1 Tax=Fusarium gaditjirri TaxID=282569 RepID=A0A8H4SUT6_9HYPO|nr:hypothetical protein FGADI_11387 [Fusarium gaditjirri]
MGYPCQVFHASELPERAQINLSGRKRKLDKGVNNVELSGCELLEMLQYKCEIKEPVKPDSPVQCFAVERLFRKETLTLVELNVIVSPDGLQSYRISRRLQEVDDGIAGMG